MQQRFLSQLLLLAQHVSGTTMPIIRSSRVLYSGCCLWYFVLWFSSCWSGAELKVDNVLRWGIKFNSTEFQTNISSDYICDKFNCKTNEISF